MQREEDAEVANLSPWLAYCLLMLNTQPQAMVRLGCGKVEDLIIENRNVPFVEKKV